MPDIVLVSGDTRVGYTQLFSLWGHRSLSFGCIFSGVLSPDYLTEHKNQAGIYWKAGGAGTVGTRRSNLKWLPEGRRLQALSQSGLLLSASA